MKSLDGFLRVIYIHNSDNINFYVHKFYLHSSRSSRQNIGISSVLFALKNLTMVLLERTQPTTQTSRTQTG